MKQCPYANPSISSICHLTNSSNQILLMWMSK